MNEMRSWSGKQWLAFLIQFVIVLLVVFGKWLGYSLNYLFGTTSDSTTLLGVGKLLSNLGNIIGDEADGLIALAVLIYVLLAVGVWMCVKTVLSIFRSEEIKPHGFLYGIGLFVVMLLLVLIANGVVNSESDGYVPRLFTLEVCAYFTLVLGVLGVLVCKKMPDVAMDSVLKVFHTNKTGAPVPPKAPGRFCPNCGSAVHSEDSQFCFACGAKLEQERYCTNCGRKLEKGMRFCPICGKDCTAPKV